MTTKRNSLWDRNRQSKYWDDKRMAQKRATARQDGEAAARQIDGLWGALGEDERQVMAYLLLSGRRSVVGLYEDALYRGLVDKGLLQLPPGVGTLLMHKLETSYRVPNAVWRELSHRKANLFPADPAALRARLRETAAFVMGRLRVSQAGEPMPGDPAETARDI